MKLAIMSDSHDNWQNLEKAITRANEDNCEVLLFAGDLIAPPGVEILKKFKGIVNYIWGNNEMERVGITRSMDNTKNLKMCGDYFEGEIDHIKIFMSHQPKYAELAAKSGIFNLCIHGHDHTYHDEVIGSSILLNPGEIFGYKSGNPGFVIFDTKTKKRTKISLK